MRGEKRPEESSKLSNFNNSIHSGKNNSQQNTSTHLMLSSMQSSKPSLCFSATRLITFSSSLLDFLKQQYKQDNRFTIKQCTDITSVALEVLQAFLDQTVSHGNGTTVEFNQFCSAVATRGAYAPPSAKY